GYMTGYPPLQLALMEASVWLPLILLGILEGTRHEVTRYGWFALSGGGLALALLAGHPQTALFTAYFALAYLAWQIYTGKKNGWVFLGGAALVLGIGGGIAAVQLLPAWEYLGRTTRDGLSFLAKGNGFPFYDLFQMILPGLFSQWSPLYVSVAGVIFIGYLAWRYPKVAGFWGIAALVTVTLSFGAQTILYDLAYNFLPGFSLFRGQERAAYLVTVCGAILAGLGASQLLQDTLHEDLKRGYQVAISSIITPSLGVGFAVFSEWVKAPDGVPIERLRMVTFSVFIAVIAAVTILGIDYLQRLYMRGVIIVALIGIELFTFGRLISPNLENRPALERLAPAPAIDALIGVRGEQNDLSSRIDTIPENYGTAYALPDIRGTSPLRLATVDKLLNVSNQARLWEVFAVRWVLTPNQELSAPASIVYSDAAGGTNLHALRTPRPFARLVGTVWVEPNDDAARGILNEPAFDSLTTVILEREAGVALNPDFIGKATLLRLEPEWIVVTTEADSPTVLDVALVYYPGWTAEIDGQPAPLLKADTAMTALAMPAGEHTVTLRYSPQSYHLGMVASLAGLLGTGAFLAGVTIQARRRKRGAQG
ncbi:MAG TPA: YfhO family protein, partial [Aggregatilineales bacterium]|nr:YfhO family protein [Aggregatilineales bacterium]